jgi:hypothetical protein
MATEDLKDVKEKSSDRGRDTYLAETHVFKSSHCANIFAGVISFKCLRDSQLTGNGAQTERDLEEI